MSPDEIIKLWSENAPTEARKEQVESVLRHFFPSVRIGTYSSHYFHAQHPALVDNPIFLGGLLTVPLKKGRHVSKVYLKRIAKAVQIIRDQTQEQKEEKS